MQSNEFVLEKIMALYCPKLRIPIRLLGSRVQ